MGSARRSVRPVALHIPAPWLRAPCTVDHAGESRSEFGSVGAGTPAPGIHAAAMATPMVLRPRSTNGIGSPRSPKIAGASPKRHRARRRSKLKVAWAPEPELVDHGSAAAGMDTEEPVEAEAEALGVVGTGAAAAAAAAAPRSRPADVDMDLLGDVDESSSFDMVQSPVSSPPSTPTPKRAEDIERERTLLVLDYDDTLFPTTELRRMGYATAVEETLPEDMVEKIGRIEEQAVQMVQQCTRYGQVLLLTNAESRWLTLSTRCYMPKLLQVLAEHARVAYGREWSSPANEHDPGMWKQLAFENELRNLRQQLGPETAIRLVSVGDSTFERKAAKVAATGAEFGKVEVKTVKLMDLPSFSLLQRQLEVLCLALEPILMQRGTLDVEVALNTPTSPDDDGEGGDPLECD